jgi:phospholipid/cholesterol/gamma-HCH transport system substrate-binding protein
MRRTIRLQLVAFTIVAISALSYALVRFSSVPNLWSPPYVIAADLTETGGIYPRAEVDLLGTPVGHVSAIDVAPSGVRVSMSIDHGVRIPADVTASILNRSVIGEQYVQLTPAKAGGAPFLSHGATIPRDHTRTPIPMGQLLADVRAFARSVPTDVLQADLRNLATAFDGTGTALQHILDDSNALTDSAVHNFDDLTSLIRNSATVLNTQAQLGNQTIQTAGNLAQLTTTLRKLDPTFVDSFTNGIHASNEAADLLSSNADAVSRLLTNLLSLEDTLNPRLQAIRKSLLVLPYVVQNGFVSTRYCDQVDPKTGQPIASTCHYDPKTGEPLWSEHFAIQLPETPGSPPVNPCTAGYQSTKRYLPNGQPANGSGPAESENQPANLQAGCTASPRDPNTPNVRGHQNVNHPGSASETTESVTATELYDPASGTVVASDGSSYQVTGGTGPRPPTGDSGLAWLLTQPLQK